MSIFTPKEIELSDGQKLRLRSPEVDDAQKLLDRFERVRAESTGLTSSPDDELPTLEWERDWVRGCREGGGVQVLAIGPSEQFVALCGIHAGKVQRMRHRGELGISLDAAWCGRGLGTLLMHELIAWAEADAELEVLTLCVNADNPRAMHVYEKVGFVREGERRWGTKRGGRYIGEVYMSRWVGGPEEPWYISAG